MSPRKLSTTVAGEAYAEVSGSSLEDPTAGCDHQSGELGKGENGRQEKAPWEGVSPGPSSASCVVGTETSARARLGGASIHSANCLSGEPGPAADENVWLLLRGRHAVLNERAPTEPTPTLDNQGIVIK
jgi:hypothetical protein